MGLNRKASWRKEKIPRVLCAQAILVKKNSIRGDNGDFVCVPNAFSSLFPTPPFCPSFVISMGKLGNVIITENIVGPWLGRGPVPGSAGRCLFLKKKNFFF